MMNIREEHNLSNRDANNMNVNTKLVEDRVISVTI